ncbi:MAG: hypothetical protein HC923_06490, partial [Myxococcales bacterium]|nr:hypothetical protein [Myxococcales bacterium]
MTVQIETVKTIPTEAPGTAPSLDEVKAQWSRLGEKSRSYGSELWTDGRELFRVGVAWARGWAEGQRDQVLEGKKKLAPKWLAALQRPRP